MKKKAKKSSITGSSLFFPSLYHCHASVFVQLPAANCLFIRLNGMVEYEYLLYVVIEPFEYRI